ncbi:MAG: AraC family transcriptional regulator [Clostridia bacterium]|nr:AraC family transcriptional regulator [Clostridia bacterium]
MNEIIYAGRHEMMLAVNRHAHESWEFVYCTEGSGAFSFDDRELTYRKGDVVIIPPLLPHANASESGFENIHLNISLPTFSAMEPIIIQDDGNHFLLDAFRAALFHYQCSRPEKAIFLSAYGNLICCYLAAYHQERRRSPVVEEIERDILEHFDEPDYELDEYLRSLPFNYDYLRKLFQKEMLITPHQYLNNKRLQVAAEALVAAELTSVSVADVARMCGFREPLYFSRMFKKKYGVAPSFYVQSRQRNNNAPILNSDLMKVPPQKK